MATIVGYGYEGLAEDATIPTGGMEFWTEFHTSLNTVTAKAAAASVGAMGARFLNTNSGTTAYLRKAFTATNELSMSLDFDLPVPPSTGQQRLLGIRNASAVHMMRLDQNSDNRLLVRNAAGTTISTPQMGMAVAGTVGDRIR